MTSEMPKSPLEILHRHRTASVAELRQRITRMEGRSPALTAAEQKIGSRWESRVMDVDAALPQAGLGMDAVHEIVPATYGDRAAALGFSLALLRRKPRPGPLLWCLEGQRVREAGLPYGPALKIYGIAPDDLILVAAEHRREVLWAIEEGLRARALGAVVGEMDDLDFTASRRLALAARESGTSALLILGSGHEGATAAETRWRVAAVPGSPNPWNIKAPGLGRWQVELMKCRGGAENRRMTPWTLEWSDETGDFRLAAELADRPVTTQPGKTAPETRRLRRAG